LNIGGIANISYKENGKRVAFDICPANMILNHLANTMGKEFDEDGALGQAGTIDNDLLNKLNQLPYYSIIGAKSLGREWFNESFLPIIENSTLPFSDIVRTAYEHISNQISGSFEINPKGKVLVTGGGAKNKFLIHLIRSKSQNEIVIPNPQIIDYKEAMVFGFLAILFQLGTPSCLSSVTGASQDSIGGCLHK
jgi:anhydro-N-acetylmuramic acid kinase